MKPRMAVFSETVEWIADWFDRPSSPSSRVTLWMAAAVRFITGAHQTEGIMFRVESRGLGGSTL